MAMHDVMHTWRLQLSRFSRRELFRNGGLLTLGGLFDGRPALAADTTPAGLHIGADLYESLGVRP